MAGEANRPQGDIRRGRCKNGRVAIFAVHDVELRLSNDDRAAIGERDIRGTEGRWKTSLGSGETWADMIGANAGDNDHVEGEDVR